MKTKEVFPSREIAHIWASQTQAYGRSPSNMRFDGPAFYSYGTVIARIGEHKKQKYVIFDNSSFSNSTSKHQGCVRHAASHLKIFYVSCGRRGQSLDPSPKQIVDHYRKRAEDKAGETSRYKHQQYSLLGAIVRLYSEAIDAAEFFGLGTAKLKAQKAKVEERQAPLKKAHDAYWAKADARREARRKANRERWERADQARKEEMERGLKVFLADFKSSYPPHEYQVPEESLTAFKEQMRLRREWEAEEGKLDLEKWRAGEGEWRSGFHEFPCFLRVVGDEIETSHGASIPYTHGRLAFNFYLKNRGSGWHANGKTFKVGRYNIESIDSTGVKAGCHFITHDSIMELAKSEGWLKTGEQPPEEQS